MLSCPKSKPLSCAGRPLQSSDSGSREGSKQKFGTTGIDRKRGARRKIGVCSFYQRLIQWSIKKKRGENDVAGQLIRPFEFVSLHHQKLHFICPWLEASSSRLPVGTIPVFSKRRPRCIASRKPNKSQSLLQHVAPSIASTSRTQVSE